MLAFMISVVTEGELEGLGNIGLSYHTVGLKGHKNFFINNLINQWDSSVVCW